MRLSQTRRSNALAGVALLLALTSAGAALIRVAGAASLSPRTIGASAFT